MTLALLAYIPLRCTFVSSRCFRQVSLCTGGSDEGMRIATLGRWTKRSEHCTIGA